MSDVKLIYPSLFPTFLVIPFSDSVQDLDLNQANVKKFNIQ